MLWQGWGLGVCISNQLLGASAAEGKDQCERQELHDFLAVGINLMARGGSEVTEGRLVAQRSLRVV